MGLLLPLNQKAREAGLVQKKMNNSQALALVEYALAKYRILLLK
jgi:hypothetical protein